MRASVSIGSVVAHTSPRYVSFAVDLARVTGGTFWSQAPHAVGNAPVARYDFGRRRLRELAQALSPAFLQISGTAANATYYNMAPTPATAPPAGYKLVLTRAEWDAVNAFCAAARPQRGARHQRRSGPARCLRCLDFSLLARHGLAVFVRQTVSGTGSGQPPAADPRAPIAVSTRR
jgi:hypothetical protein